MIKNRSLKRLGLYVLSGMFLVLISEYVIIKYKIEVLEEVEEKKDFARSTQLAGQQFALLLQEYFNDQPGLSSDIISRIEQQDYHLKILGEGGRIAESDVFIEPLSRLPKITFNELEKSWRNYKQSILRTLLPAETEAADSLEQYSPAASRTLLAGQSLTLSSWFKRLEADLTEEATARKNSVETWVLLFILFDLALLASLYYIFIRFVLKPIKTLETDTRNLHQNFSAPSNEIGELTLEVNEALEQLKDATDFVEAIGEGRLDFDYKTLDAHYTKGRNKLADSLISMQARLKEMNMEEQRRQWANDGLTKFVDILRSSNDNINTLGDKIISALVQYTNSNQGGLYTLNDENERDKYLELISLFAFDKKRFEQQKIKLGEGILGQTFMEKQTTVITELPDEYVRITSGLGDANPRAILMVPLKVDEQVYGIVELASFKAYQEHEIAFVEKLAETIASTLASVKAAEKNRQLIEQFQEQTEQMRAQEEEVRQNMEELQATQEEMARKERDYIARIKDLEASKASQTEKDAELTKLKDELASRESAYQKQLLDLEAKMSATKDGHKDWELAHELGKTLQFQIEALKISQDEFPAK